jgi:hypothetical protein
MTGEQNIRVAKDFITSFNNSDWESFETILCPESTYLEKPNRCWKKLPSCFQATV